jgi:hypothetical protein
MAMFNGKLVVYQREKEFVPWYCQSPRFFFVKFPGQTDPRGFDPRVPTLGATWTRSWEPRMGCTGRVFVPS